MFEWSEEQLPIRDAVRRFVEEEIKPNVEELEHGDTPAWSAVRVTRAKMRWRNPGAKRSIWASIRSVISKGEPLGTWQ